MQGQADTRFPARKNAERFDLPENNRRDEEKKKTRSSPPPIHSTHESVLANGIQAHARTRASKASDKGHKIENKMTGLRKKATKGIGKETGQAGAVVRTDSNCFLGTISEQRSHSGTAICGNRPTGQAVTLDLRWPAAARPGERLLPVSREGCAFHLVCLVFRGFFCWILFRLYTAGRQKTIGSGYIAWYFLFLWQAGNEN